MDLARSFDAVNRTQTWVAIYRKGIPIKAITRNGHKHTTLQAKYNTTYGPKIGNKIGVSHGSAASELLCIMYLDDMVGGDHALNHLDQIPYRQTAQLVKEAQLERRLLNLKHKKHEEKKEKPREETNTSEQKTARKQKRYIKKPYMGHIQKRKQRGGNDKPQEDNGGTSQREI